MIIKLEWLRKKRSVWFGIYFGGEGREIMNVDLTVPETEWMNELRFSGDNHNSNKSTTTTSTAPLYDLVGVWPWG